MTYSSQHVGIMHLVPEDSTKLSFTSLYTWIYSVTPFQNTFGWHLSDNILLLETSHKSKKINRVSWYILMPES